jgi:hypothetical protein
LLLLLLLGGCSLYGGSAGTTAWGWVVAPNPPATPTPRHSQGTAVGAGAGAGAGPNAITFTNRRLQQKDLRSSAWLSPLYSKKKRAAGGGGSQDSSSSIDDTSVVAEPSTASASAAAARTTLQLAKSLVEDESSSNDAAATRFVSGATDVAEDDSTTALPPAATVLSADRRSSNGSDRQLAMLSADDVDDETQVYGAVDSRFDSPAAALQGGHGDAEDDSRVQLAWSSAAANDQVEDGDRDDSEEVVRSEDEMALHKSQNEVPTEEEALRMQQQHQEQQDDAYMRLAIQTAEGVYVP